MTKVVLEKRVVDMVICRGTKTEPMKHFIPWESVFRVDHSQPVSVGTPEGHICPDVTMNQICSAIQWNKNHADCIQDRSIESVKQTWVFEYMVRFVRVYVECRVEVFKSMHNILNSILNDQAEKHFWPFDSPFK